MIIILINAGIIINIIIIMVINTIVIIIINPIFIIIKHRDDYEEQVSGSEDEEVEEELETDGRALVERIVITLR